MRSLPHVRPITTLNETFTQKLYNQIMKKKCVWTHQPYTPYATLVGKTTATYLIVGGGVTGLFVAHYLLKKGAKNITLIEGNTIGSGSTGYAAGMLVGAVETSIEDLIQEQGPKAASAYLHYQKFTQKDVLRLIKKEGIRCDLEERPLYHFHTESSAGVYFEKSISVNPRKFAHGIAAYLRKNGVRIHENTRLLRVTKNIAHTPGGSVAFDTIIHARGTSLKNTDLTNYLTTICVTRTLTKKEIQRVKSMHRAMFFCDGKKSYHYGKITHDKRLLIGYGDVRQSSSKTKASLHAPHVRSIQHFMKRVLGMNLTIDSAWSAAFSLTSKPLPYVSLSENAVGGAGTQIASIAAASYLVSRLMGHKHPLTQIFSHVQNHVSKEIKSKN